MPAPDIEIAETARFRLIVPSPNRARQFCDYVIRNYEFHRLAMPTPPKGWDTVEYWEERLAARYKQHLKGTVHGFAILQNDAIQGDMSFTQVTGEPQFSTVLGYKLDQRAEGQGVMHETLTAAIQWMFREHELHRIEANVRPENKRSSSLLLSLGFVVEGYSYGYLRLDGEWCDHIRYALFNPAHINTPPPSLELPGLG